MNKTELKRVKEEIDREFCAMENAVKIIPNLAQNKAVIIRDFSVAKGAFLAGMNMLALANMDEYKMAWNKYREKFDVYDERYARIFQSAFCRLK